MFGYWELFIQDEGYKLVEKNFDSFFSIIYPIPCPLTENGTSPRLSDRALLQPEDNHRSS
ncbi:hypothetical protein C8Q74DRAFT_1373165 [Fomes fomentarius]|nr:hypothetical protein C8Q74DRAFT_1373165 [Fomes fomentarius]